MATTKTENKDQWKEDLRSAYDTSARRQIEASDKSYDQAISNEFNRSLAAGMQRSSYRLARQANLDSDKVKAQNTIRENAEAAYNQAVLQQQNVQDQLDFQKEQAAQSQANWQAQFDASRADAAQSQQNWQASFDASRADAAQSQQNWQASFDASQKQQDWSNAFQEKQFAANQQQQAWQNQFQQSQFDWQKQQAAEAAAQAAASASASAGSGYDSRKPWEKLGISEEEYNKLYGNGNNNGGLFGNVSNSKFWTNAYNAVSKYYGQG